jgi:hypothetical protein
MKQDQSRALSVSIPRAQPFARRRWPFQPPRWPSDISERIQSRFRSFRVHVQLRPPASLPNSAAAPAIGREHAQGQPNAGSESFSRSLLRCLFTNESATSFVARITVERRAVQAIKRVRQHVDVFFRDALADQAGSQGAPRSPRIRFRQCDLPRSRSRARPQQPNGVCRLARPKAHEAGLPRIGGCRNYECLCHFYYMGTLAAKKRALVGQSPSSIRGAPPKPTYTILPRPPTWTRDVR